MKKSLLFVAFAAVVAVTFVTSAHQVSAKSAKWYCYAPDPTTPWIQTCYSSTRRP